MANAVDTSEIRQWRSVVTLIAFVIANILVLWPFHFPIYIPKSLVNLIWGLAAKLRIIPSSAHHDVIHNNPNCSKYFVRFTFPLNFITAPLIADLFLLAISAIGREEVYAGTIGADNIHPIDIMLFFITLAYIAISIDASGIIRWLAFKVLSMGGKVGHQLFFYLYSFFFLLGSFIGNDPIILSGTAFLAYMTRVSSNITSPRAWIFSQFAIANIASAILVSSNPTNLVLAGAFDIKFIVYTANMIVPVVVTALVLFPFLLYVIFADEKLIPSRILMHELPEEVRRQEPVNPNIPYVQSQAEDGGEEAMARSLAYIMNPFLDKKGAAFGALIMAATLITVLALNAASAGTGEHPVYWVTVPAAFVMLCWDLGSGWLHRHETRQTAASYRREMEEARAERAERDESYERAHGASSPADLTSEIKSELETDTTIGNQTSQSPVGYSTALQTGQQGISLSDLPAANNHTNSQSAIPRVVLSNTAGNSPVIISGSVPESPIHHSGTYSDISAQPDAMSTLPNPQMEPEKLESNRHRSDLPADKANLLSEAKKAYGSLQKGYMWSQETFPTVMAVMAHLPFALVPFAFAMFVLVQALVSKGWVNVFAYGWYHWSKRTGTVGSIGGMGFLSCVLSNFSGTNIGTTILLSRIIQAWKEINCQDTSLISDRTYWGTIYGMALGVNYGAFSTAFSASLAGLLWRDILARKHIHVKSHEFARVNFPIIAISMAVGCLILVGEVYIVRDNSPYSSYENACSNS
ncbi:putative arsenite efflux transporter ArsB-like protein [Fusarium tricinctum]|uniref:Arsenite efflux transporter ArsB-like protein n=1 Tax=Fusarium tricinctum TaxID=61284 RepID=A0A8K0RXF0_9HYPO|nr:putative arsenite efflux transporter ArsB-like protein [Fusarium tricinctum]